MLDAIRERAHNRANEMFSMGRVAGEKAPRSPLSMAAGQHSSYGVQSQDIQVHAEQLKYAKRGWSYAAIRPIANRVAAQQLKVASVSGATSRKPKRGRDVEDWQKAAYPTWVKSIHGGMTILDQHPLLDSVCHPNDLMVQWALAWLTAASLQATGKAYWWFTPRTDPQAEGKIGIWPVPPHWVEPVHEGGFNSAWKITPEGSTQSFDVPGNELAYFSFPDPQSPFNAVSPLAAAGRPILNDDAIHESQYHGFQGGHTPDHAFILGEKVSADGTKYRPEITREQRMELEARFKNLYGGPRKHGRFIILDGLIADVKRISMAPTEMDYLASMKLTKLEIMQIFGVNPIIAGEVENANRASSQVADDIFTTNVVNPMLAMIGQVLTQFVRKCPLFDAADRDDIAFYEECRTNDPELHAKNFFMAYDRGILNDDDVRVQVLGMPPKTDGGQVARIQAQLVTIPVASAATTSATNGNGKRTPAVRVLTRKDMSDLWIRTHAEQESRFSKSIEDIFQRQARSAIDKLNGLHVIVPSALFNPQDWNETRDELLRVSASNVRRIAAAGAGIEDATLKHRLASIKAVDDIFATRKDRIQTGIEEFTAQLFDQPYWSDINKWALEEIEFIVDMGTRDSLTVGEISERIREVLPERAIERAMRIARTETTAAINAGQHAVRKELAEDGLVLGKEWSSIVDQFTRGSRVRDQANHIEMNGVRVGVYEDFNLDGELAPYPGWFRLSAKQRVNCRCEAISLTLLDFDDAGLFKGADVKRLGHCAVHAG